jgi:hypothetical protein
MSYATTTAVLSSTLTRLCITECHFIGNITAIANLGGLLSGLQVWQLCVHVHAGCHHAAHQSVLMCWSGRHPTLPSSHACAPQELEGSWQTVVTEDSLQAWLPSLRILTLTNAVVEGEVGEKC